jgi:hypothetical protein
VRIRKCHFQRIPNSGLWEFSLEPFETERHIVLLGDVEIHNKHVSCFINIFQGSTLEVSISARFVPTGNVIPAAVDMDGEISLFLSLSRFCFTLLTINCVFVELRTTTDYGLYGSFDDYCEEDEVWSDEQYSCEPIDCYSKYGDEKPLFDDQLRKCVPIEECEDGEFYQEWTNACYPMEMEDLDDDDDDDSDAVIVVRCRNDLPSLPPQSQSSTSS